MPPAPRGTVAISERCMGGNIARLMQRHRYLLENLGDDSCDFLCGGTRVLYVDDLNRLCDMAHRDMISQRLSLAKSRFNTSGSRIALLLLSGSQDPRPDVLAWLNIHCSVELNCLVMLCWTEEECASFLEGLADSSLGSVNYRIARKKESTPVPVLIDAFTQTPQLMTRNDVVRAAHRFGSAAKLFTVTSEDLAVIPGFGQKKAERLFAVLNASFQTSRRSVSEVLPSQTAPNDVDKVGKESVRLPAQEKMFHVLHQLREREMDEVTEE
ncbi:putative DNA repair protein [Trypanosoma theileri]|uniref:Putative DNA repair protein n=1 Tax=Trypanosoma theileri TaxID=67003 RepID=A0A1X0NUS6_9TRYP|nr:putative DNA repair protein [Trypanosoma theileri]ORC87860.1 putative DNA repair protein [Trypanosoma theileri]